MQKFLFTVSIIICIGCNNETPNSNKLYQQLKAILPPGDYQVERISKDATTEKIPFNGKRKLTIIHSPGGIDFEGYDELNNFDSMRINFKDTTLIRKFSTINFKDTVTVSNHKTPLGEEYFGYAFFDRSKSLLDLFPGLLTEKDISGHQYLFILGKTKTQKIIIQEVERRVKDGEILVNTNNVYILKPVLY